MRSNPVEIVTVLAFTDFINFYYLLEKDWRISRGSGSSHLRDLPVDGKKLVIRQNINKKKTRRSAPKKQKFPACFLIWTLLFELDRTGPNLRAKMFELDLDFEQFPEVSFPFEQSRFEREQKPWLDDPFGQSLQPAKKVLILLSKTIFKHTHSKKVGKKFQPIFIDISKS